MAKMSATYVLLLGGAALAAFALTKKDDDTLIGAPVGTTDDGLPGSTVDAPFTETTHPGDPYPPSWEPRTAVGDPTSTLGTSDPSLNPLPTVADLPINVKAKEQLTKHVREMAEKTGHEVPMWAKL